MRKTIACVGRCVPTFAYFGLALRNRSSVLSHDYQLLRFQVARGLAAIRLLREILPLR